MRRVLAVDGGQSSIRVCAPDGALMELPGVSHQAGDGVALVAEAVTRAWQATGGAAADRAVLGLTTAPTTDDDRDRLCRLVAGTTGVPEVWLADDAVTAHAGALSMGAGISVTVGTGVACLVLPLDGGPARLVGGHGFLLGDEGGATWIGREAIRAVLRAHDGRGPATTLAGPVVARFGPLDGMADRIHRSARPIDDIARSAPDVVETADATDEVATAIVDAAVEELVLLVAAAAAPTAGDAPTPGVPVAIGGRLVAPGTSLRRRLDAALAARLPGIVARSADGGPLDGARLLGQADDPGPYTALVHRWVVA